MNITRRDYRAATGIPDPDPSPVLEATLEAVPTPHPAFMLTLGAIVGAGLVVLGAVIARWIA